MRSVCRWEKLRAPQAHDMGGKGEKMWGGTGPRGDLPKEGIFRCCVAVLLVDQIGPHGLALERAPPHRYAEGREQVTHPQVREHQREQVVVEAVAERMRWRAAASVQGGLARSCRAARHMLACVS